MLFYNLMNKYFGLEYVSFRFAGDDFIHRVIVINGRKCIKSFGCFRFLDMMSDWEYFYITPKEPQ